MQRSNDKADPIEWLVVQKRGDKRLLLSLKALEYMPFNENVLAFEWRSSTLRDWLNGPFANAAFCAEEYSRVLNIPVGLPLEPTVRSLRTVDHDSVFLLSRAELEVLLPHAAERVCLPSDLAILRKDQFCQAEQKACSW